MKTIRLLYLLSACCFISCTSQGEAYELKNFPKGAQPEEVGKRIVTKYLATPHTRFGNPRAEKAPNYVTYPDACTWLGALWFAKATHNKGMATKLKYSWQTRIWIDDMFMITTIQSQAYKVTGDDKYINRAAREMVMYLKEIQRPNGLFYHAPTAPFFWGRGNGWMAAGMAELLAILPENNENRPAIMEAYKKMMATLKSYQGEDGMWKQLIDEPASWNETSSTAMFTYAMIVGVKRGWLDQKEYGTVARKGWIALTGYINEENEITDVCEGTNIKNDKDHYMNRKRIVGDLHAHAPLLWCASELLSP